MTTFLALIMGKSISFASRLLRTGNGSTWPGHVALYINKTLIQTIVSHSKTKIIIIAGTNGKTTTSRMLTQVLRGGGKSVIQNTSGANLLNGIASTIVKSASISGKLLADYAIFEVDEYNVPILLKQLTPHAIIVLNLFRDQLDRYGELDSIAIRWKESFAKCTNTQFILNADDPLIAYMGHALRGNTLYFGLEEKATERILLQHAADSIYCPKCHSKLIYTSVFYSHLGLWRCPVCGLKHPKTSLSNFFYPLPGTYNKYNTLAAVLYARHVGIEKETIENSLKQLTPAFGRQEVVVYKNKKIQIFLSKNPTSFNESLKTVKELGADTMLLVLNDRIPDGRDVSWIWDVDFEEYLKHFKHIYVTGDRVWDMVLRLQYASENNGLSTNINIEEELEAAIEKALLQTKKKNMLYVLPTYSAMLEVRDIIVGRKIL